MENIDIYNTPAMLAPSGDVNNLVNPDSQQTGLIVAAACCLILTTIFASIRISTKAFVLRAVRIEDYSIIAAQLGLAAFTGVIIMSGTYGQGRHLWNVSLAGVIQVANLSNISEILYGPTMFFAKFSVLKQMERIFVGTKKGRTYWWIQAMIWANGLFDLSIFIAFICACIPRDKLWNPKLPGTCISTNTSIIATSIINIISDWSALILPLVVVHRLQMSPKQKLGIMAIFAVGLLACVASIIRLVYSIQLIQTFDETWAIDPVAIWAFVEFATVILSGCFPILPKFVQFLRYGRNGAPKRNTANGTYIMGSSQRRTLPSTMDSSVGRRDDLKQGMAIPREYIPLDDEMRAGM